MANTKASASSKSRSKKSTKIQTTKIHNLDLPSKEMNAKIKAEMIQENRQVLKEGGPIEENEVVTFFQTLNYALLPSKFSDYVKTEILTDSDLEFISAKEPVFIELKKRVEDVLNGAVVIEPEISEDKKQC